MPALAQRRETPAPASASAEVEAPDWSTPVSGSGSNAEVVALISGAQVDGATADQLLSPNGDSGSESENPEWAQDNDEAQADAWEGRAFAEDKTAATNTAPPPASTKTAAAEAAPAPTGVLAPVHARHQRELPKMKATLSRTQRHELERFRENWTKNQGRYAAVAAKTGVPAILIAAIHYRESSMNFNTYLHQGDPLGKPAKHHPKNIPIFYKWEEAAVHALNSKKGVRDAVGLTADSTDATAMATYAEAYNGLGYHNRGLTSPYVYAGSDRYRGGRYVADGKFDPRSFDGRLGTATIIDEMGGAQTPEAPAAGPGRPAPAAGDGWEAVLSGDKLLDRGDRGPAVRAAQERLKGLGYNVTVDGDFGPMTVAAVTQFQRDRSLVADGVIGVGTAAALEKGGAPAKSSRENAWGDVLSGKTLLKAGSSGDAVVALQERLRARGYGISKDGRFGPSTRAAIYDLQHKLRLSVDGEVGPKTAAALDQAVGR